MSNGGVRILVAVVGVLCLAAGTLFGWIAATERGPASEPAAAPVVAQRAAAAQSAASQSATTSEGWSRVAQGAYALAKAENAAAQTARKQALEAAARAEKAAARADAAVAAAAVRPVRRAAPHVAAARNDAPEIAATAPARVAIAPKPVAPAIDEGCRRAIIYERSAAAAASRLAAYNAAMSGLAMNAHCAEPQRTLDEAYLLAQRASAESALRVGDWQTDLRRSDELLGRCIANPERFGTTRARCRTRLLKNVRIRAAAHGRNP